MCAFLLLLLCLSVPLASAQVVRFAELNTTQVERLDRAHTVVLITNGILEEHGPYLPSFTDGYWDEAVAASLARKIVEKPGWTVVMLPTIPLGTNAANVVALRWSFPGSVTVRQETLRSVFMDLADSLGEQGFRYVFIVDSHGGPTNSLALDAASDYFHDTYKGEMVHLLGLMPVVECCKALEEMLTPKQLAENGMSIHADALEQSQGLYVREDLVPASYRAAPLLGGADFAALMQVAQRQGWPGYLGAPAYGSVALGARFFAQETEAVNRMAVSILDGATDPRKLPRYGGIMFGMTTGVEKPLLVHEAEQAERQRKWLAAHPPQK